MNPQSARPNRSIAAAVVEAAIVVLVWTASLAALSGLPRYDVGQTALGALAAAAVIGACLVALARGTTLVRRRPAAVALSWTCAVAFVTVSAFIAGHAEAFDHVARLSLPLAFVLAAVAAPRGARIVGALAVGLAVAATFAAVAAVAQRVGLAVPEAIPFSTPSTAGMHATFDDPQIAAVWFGLTALAGAVLAIDSRRSIRIAGAFALLLSAVGLGLTGEWVLIGFVGAAGVAACAAAPSFATARVALAAPVIAAVLASTVTLDAAPDADRVFDANTIRVPFAQSGQDWPYSADGAIGFYLESSLAYAMAGQPFGHGAAAFLGELPRHHDYDSAFALAHTDGVPTARRSPSPLLQLAGDFGFTVPLFVLLALGLAIRRDEFAPERSALAGAGVLAVGLCFVFGPGLLTAAGLTAAGSLLALALAERPTADADTPSEDPGPFALIAVPLAITCAVAVGSQVGALRWGIPAAASTVFLGHGMIEEAAEQANTASRLQQRFESEVNAAVAEALVPGADRSHDGVTAHLQAAIDLRPASAGARYFLANHYVRLAGSDPQEIDERQARASRMTARVVDIDSNFVPAALLHADTLVARGRTSEAAEWLERFAERPLPPPIRARVLERLGTVAGDFLEDPNLALRAYTEASELTTDPHRRATLDASIDTMQTWIETGSRPISNDGHGHGDAHGPAAPEPGPVGGSHDDGH